MKKYIYITIAAGFFLGLTDIILSINFVPIQDLEDLPQNQKIKILKELPINYSLGIILKFGGIWRNLEYYSINNSINLLIVMKSPKQKGLW